jgi:hypothetical protein
MHLLLRIWKCSAIFIKYSSVCLFHPNFD